MNDFCREYAAALYSLAQGDKCEDEISEQLAVTEKIFSENPDYLKILSLPIVSRDEKNALLDEAFADMHEYVRSFLKLLKDRHAINEFSGCVKAFSGEYDAAHGIERAVAVTAVPLSEHEMEQIRNKLSEKTKKNIVLENKIDSSILGGILLRFGGREINASVKMRLDEMLGALINS